ARSSHISDGCPINVWLIHCGRQANTASLLYADSAPGVHNTEPRLLSAERINSKLSTKLTLSIFGIMALSLLSTCTLPATAPQFLLVTNGLTRFLRVSGFTTESLSTVTNISPVPRLKPRYRACLLPLLCGCL